MIYCFYISLLLSRSPFRVHMFVPLPFLLCRFCDSLVLAMEPLLPGPLLIFPTFFRSIIVQWPSSLYWYYLFLPLLLLPLNRALSSRHPLLAFYSHWRLEDRRP